MDKKYSEFMNEISADELYEGFLAYGLFSEKVPPMFTSVPFFDYCNNLSLSSAWSDYVTFRTMRNIGVPRIMGIPNPFRYQILCAELKEDWNIIRTHFHKQTDNQLYRISRVHIRKEKDKKSIFKMGYKNWREDGNPESDLLIHTKQISRYLVKADISTCFPSIYTHSISWALVGKEEAKRSAKDKKVWYNRIDQACSDMRNGETHGLLIGPHASNLLSEIILTVVDKNLYDKGYRFTRSIDDYDCYSGSYEEAERFLRDLEEALREFDLPLNHKKTEIIKLPIEIEENWKHQLSDLPRIDKSGMVEYSQVNLYIDTALKLATETNNFAILNYAIKKLSSFRLYESSKKLAAKRFMHMAVLYPYLLTLMEEYVFIPYTVASNQIKEMADALYYDAKKINDYESITYAIYYAIKYDFPLNAFELDYEKEQNEIINGKDCLALTMMWVYFMKQNHWNRKATQVKPINKVAMELKNKEKDFERYWLFCYEALNYGSLAGEWRQMKQAGISFIRKDIIDSADIIDID